MAMSRRHGAFSKAEKGCGRLPLTRPGADTCPAITRFAVMVTALPRQEITETVYLLAYAPAACWRRSRKIPSGRSLVVVARLWSSCKDWLRGSQVRIACSMVA
jgi:hypothetical protein